MPNKDRITYLFNRCLLEQETLSEREELDAYLLNPDYREIVEWCLMDAFEVPKSTDSLSEDVQSQILTAILTSKDIKPKKSSRIQILKWAAAAAVACLFVTVPLIIKTDLHQRIMRFSFTAEKLEIPVTADKVEKVALPASEAAILEMTDGTKLELPKLAIGTQIIKNGLIVQKTANNELLLKYTKHYKGQLLTGEKHVIKTPRGGTYSLTLPDGSRVQLNSATTLILPASFNDTIRSVELQGEAFFEIVKNKKMFKVYSKQGINRQEISVYGTSFNISAYSNDKHLETTLVTGSINVKNLNNNKALWLQPNQTALVSNDQMLQVEANLDKNLSWINNIFYFEDESLDNVINQIGRWYDVDFKNMPQSTTQRMWAQVSRDVTLQELLEIIEKTYPIKFKIIGKEVHVLN
ncbi:FecR family protein [Sphingobacterium rhinopitheci]|uniref:FecR family protein n=1 Tax=Sphingobacterium rhinopitheci TaxID=2781960 RepID=UPI001F518BF9|nr:FecR family protein [Sphingobacterium rhinopitheci]MCI0921207.1 FecR family protein [Sphingobacterium rhinopitheci]